MSGTCPIHTPKPSKFLKWSKQVEMTHSLCVEQLCRSVACWNRTAALSFPIWFCGNVSSGTWHDTPWLLSLSQCVHSFTDLSQRHAYLQLFRLSTVCWLLSFLSKLIASVCFTTSRSVVFGWMCRTESCVECYRAILN